MKTGISITGPTVTKASVNEITTAILKIISTPAGDDVKRHALDALTKPFCMGPTTVTNCSFQGLDK